MNLDFNPLKEYTTAIMFVTVIVAIVTFVYSFYIIFSSRLRKYSLFDIAFIIIFFVFIAARIGGVLNNWDYYSGLNWRLVPYQDAIDIILYIPSLPWEIINVFDGNFLFYAVPLGFILGGLFIYLISNKKKNIFDFTDKIIVAAIPANIVLGIGLFLVHPFYGNFKGVVNIMNPDINTYQFSPYLSFIALFLINIIISLISSQILKNRGAMTSIYLSFIAVIFLFILPNTTENRYYIGDYPWSKYLGLLLIVTVLIINFFIVADILKLKTILSNREVTTNSQELLNQEVLSDIDLNKKSLWSRITSIFRR